MMEWHIFQTWDGGKYNDVLQGQINEVTFAYNRHMRVMPNCPARILRVVVEDSFTPGGRGQW